MGNENKIGIHQSTLRPMWPMSASNKNELPLVVLPCMRVFDNEECKGGAGGGCRRQRGGKGE